VTTLDLNDIIHEVERIFDRDMQAMQNLADLNQPKADELAEERCHFRAQKLQFETVRANTAILDVLKKQDLVFKNALSMATILLLDCERRAQKPPMPVDTRSPCGAPDRLCGRLDAHCMRPHRLNLRCLSGIRDAVHQYSLSLGRRQTGAFQNGDCPQKPPFLFNSRLSALCTNRRLSL
jgi:hypothetical protein